MNRLLSGAALAAITAFASTLAQAQAYPAKPIRAIVPFPAGQAADVLARFMSERLQSELGQQIVVDNRAGAGGAIGTEVAAKAPADGYTLYVGSSGPISISPHLYKKVGYDPLRDFVPISNLAAVTQVLLTTPDGSIKSVRDMIDQARANPGKLQFASSGSGSTSHLAMELLTYTAGVKLDHVPYKGGPPAQLDVMAGRVPLMFDAAPGILANVRAGKLRAIGVSSSQRLSFLPDVPTIAESGVQGFSVTGWIGLLAPTGTPAPIVERLHAAVVKVMTTPEAKKRFDDLAFTPILDTPKEFAQFLEKDIALWRGVVQRSGATAE